MSVSEHYSRESLLERILEVLAADGRDVDALAEADLMGIDELHSRGRGASEELLAISGFQHGMRILDVGCGVGGPARRLARHGLLVVGIDLTPDFVRVSDDLTRRSGLASLASFRVADALNLPFDACSFDGVWLQHVNMNISDKGALFQELQRVLKPGGTIAIHEVVSGPGGDPYLPVPWASRQSHSFLETDHSFRVAIESSGLRVEAWRNDTAPTLAFFSETARRSRQVTGSLGPAVVFGPDFYDALANFRRSLAEDRCRVLMGTAVKPYSRSI